MTSLLTTAARRLLPTLRSTTTTLARTQAALPLSSTIPARSFATVNARLADIVDALPHLEAVRYDRQNNIKWTVTEIKRYSDALTSGLFSLGMRPGDVALSWLPGDCAEMHVLQLACARGGFVLATLDAAVVDKAVLEKALIDSGAKAIFHQDASADAHYLQLLQEVVPEMKKHEYVETKTYQKASLVGGKGGVVLKNEEVTETRTHSKINEGLPYAGLHPKFPKLEFPIHTGFDQETGFFNYKHLLTFNSEEQHQRMQTVVNPKGGLMYKEVPRDSMLIKEAFKHEYVKQAVPKGAANPHNIPHVYISTDDDAKWIEEQTVHTPKEGDALFFEYDGSGKRGKTMTHKDVETSERWTVVSSILNKKYIEP